VQGLAFTGSDTLWAATTGGVVEWNLATGSHVQYTMADGLAANYVADVAQAPDGSLWFATLGGVSHLAGGGWTTYTFAHGLADEAVQSIAVTEDGTVWAGTTEGISRFDGASWKTHFPGDRAWQIDIGPDGAVWFACDGAGLRRYTPATDTWETFVMAGDPTAPGVKSVSIDPEGGAWVYLGYDQVYRFDGGEWEPAYGGRGWVCDVAFTADGTPWIATCDAYRTHGAGLVTREYGAWRTVNAEDGLASNAIQAVVIGPDGQIAAATNRGLSVYREGEWRTLHGGPLMNRITTVAVTPDGAAWFGFGDDSFYPTGGGVNRFDGQTWQVFDQSTGLPVSDDVHLLAVDPEGRLWAAGGGAVAYHDAGTWHRVAGCEDMTGNVAGMAFDPAGTVWMATDFTVCRIDEESRKSWNGLLPTSLGVTQDGTPLVSRSPLGEGGVSILEGDEWHPMADSPIGQGKMVTDGEGTVWAAVGGLYRWAGDAWEEVATAAGRPAGRPSDITVSPSGEVWIVTEAGIGHLGPSGWVRYGRMWEGDAYGIAVSPDGSVWLATSQGAVHVSIP
jgi:ligand-binding sensor domain-containing protein